MANRKKLNMEEELAWFDAIENRVIEERLKFAPRGVPRRLLRAIVKGTGVATKYPTMEDWLLVADDSGTGGKTQITSEVFIAVVAWHIETERVLNRTLAHER